MGIIDTAKSTMKKFLIQPQRRLPGQPVKTEEQISKTPLRQDKETEQPMELSADHDIILGYFLNDPIVNASVNVTVDNVVADGHLIETTQDTAEAEMHKLIIEGFFENNHGIILLRNMATTAVLYDDMYAEMIENEYHYPSKIYVLDTPSIEPKVDDKGKIIEYEQKVDGIVKARLAPESVMHVSLNVLGSRKTGISTVQSALLSAASKRYAELMNAMYFVNHKPRLAWGFPKGMSVEDYNANVDAIIAVKNDPQKDIFLYGAGVGDDPNTNITFKQLSGNGSEDMNWNEYIGFLRQQIMTALLVPPVLLSIPEGSNRASADIQMQAFDRRVRAIQAVLEDAINRHIIRRFGFTDVKFKFDRSGKRDLLKDVEIAKSMAGFATVNEVRIQAGLPPLDVEKFPDAENIWNGTSAIQANPYGGQTEAPAGPTTRPEFDPDQQDAVDELLGKNLKKKLDSEGEQRPAQHPLTDADEELLAGLITEHLEEVEDLALDTVKEDFTKDLNTDPASLINRIIAAVTGAKLKSQIRSALRQAYDKGITSVEKEYDRNFLPDDEALGFLENYGMDLVQGLDDDLRNRLKGVLQRSVMDGTGIGPLKAQIKDAISVSLNRAELIGRTEMNRAANMGRLNGYMQAGVKKIQWLSIIDVRTSNICKALNGQVRSPGEAFSATVDGKKIQVMACPAHPNCRSTIVALD